MRDLVGYIFLFIIFMLSVCGLYSIYKDDERRAKICKIKCSPNPYRSFKDECICDLTRIIK